MENTDNEIEQWKVGKYPFCVVSDTKVTNTNFPSPPNPRESDPSEVKHYGGYVICESVGNIAHAKLIAAAPDLLNALRNLLPQAEVLINHNHPDHKAAIAAIKKATE